MTPARRCQALTPTLLAWPPPGPEPGGPGGPVGPGLGGRAGGGGRPFATSFLLFFSVQAALLSAVGLVGVRYALARPLSSLLPPSPAGWVSGVGAGAGCGLLLAALDALVLERFLPAAWQQRTAEGLIRQLPPAARLAVAALAAVSEELLVRGFLQQTALGLLGSNLLFGVLHGLAELRSRPAALVTTLVTGGVGMALGWLFAATGNLVGPVTAHFVVDAVESLRLSR